MNFTQSATVPQASDARRAASGHAPGAARSLASLRPGQSGTVRALHHALQGQGRRRLMDLGLTPGTTVLAERAGLFRDPVAYRIRGTLIAIRRDQAGFILIFG